MLIRPVRAACQWPLPYGKHALSAGNLCGRQKTENSGQQQEERTVYGEVGSVPMTLTAILLLRPCDHAVPHTEFCGKEKAHGAWRSHRLPDGRGSKVRRHT